MDERRGRKQSHTNRTPLGTASTSCQCAWNACMGYSFIRKQAISTAGELLSVLYGLLIWKQILVMAVKWKPHLGSEVSMFPHQKQFCLYQSFLKALGLGKAQVQQALVSADKVSKIHFYLFSVKLVLSKMVLMQNALLWGRPVELKMINAVRTAQDRAKSKSPCSLSQSDH